MSMARMATAMVVFDRMDVGIKKIYDGALAEAGVRAVAEEMVKEKGYAGYEVSCEEAGVYLVTFARGDLKSWEVVPHGMSGKRVRWEDGADRELRFMPHALTEVPGAQRLSSMMLVELWENKEYGALADELVGVSDVALHLAATLIEYHAATPDDLRRLSGLVYDADVG